VGGELFYRLLFRAKVAPALHIDDSFEVRAAVHRNLPNWLRNRLATLGGLKLLLSDPNTALALLEYRAGKGGERLEPVEEILYGGYAYQFYRAIEDAKIELSLRTTSSIEFHRPRLDISILLVRGEFEDLIARPMGVVRGEILKAFELAEIGPEEVSLVLRTGGSSSIPMFVQMLEEIFGPTTVQERPVFTTVVHGLASYARELWA
jgi:hypothetical protein